MRDPIEQLYHEARHADYVGCLEGQIETMRCLERAASQEIEHAPTPEAMDAAYDRHHRYEEWRQELEADLRAAREKRAA